MIAAVNSFTNPWGGPEFGIWVFFTTDEALRGSGNDQGGSSSRQFLSLAGRGTCFLQSPSEKQLRLFSEVWKVSEFLWNLIGVWGPSDVSQPVEGAMNVSP